MESDVRECRWIHGKFFHMDRTLGSLRRRRAMRVANSVDTMKYERAP